MFGYGNFSPVALTTQDPMSHPDENPLLDKSPQEWPKRQALADYRDGLSTPATFSTIRPTSIGGMTR